MCVKVWCIAHTHIQTHMSITCVAVLPCHLGWRTLLKCNKTNHACLPACLPAFYRLVVKVSWLSACTFVYSDTSRSSTGTLAVCRLMTMYVCMHVSMYARKFVCMCVSMYARKFVCMCVCVCVCVCMYLSMYVCTHVCIYVQYARTYMSAAA
jgi:hypothetical protein